jgi:hypothetical protein
MLKKHLILALFFGIHSAGAMAADEKNPLAGLKFQSSPFEACKDVTFVSNSDFKKNEQFWHDASVECGADIQVLPDAGFASFLRTVQYKLSGDGLSDKRTEEFLKRVGTKALASTEENMRITKALLGCAMDKPDFFETKQAVPYEACKDFVKDVKDVAKEVGPTARIELAAMQKASGIFSKAGNFMKWITGTQTGIEKAPLTADEQKKVDEIVAKMTKEANEEINKQLAEMPPATDESGGAGALLAIQQQVWSKHFAEHADKYNKAIQSAPVLAYLSNPDPTDADIAHAARQVLKNGFKEAEKIRATIKDADAAYKYGNSRGRGVGPKEHDSEAASKMMFEFMKYGPIVRETLGEDKTFCNNATNTANYIANSGTRDTALIMGGMLAGGMAGAAIGPAALAAVGVGGVTAGAAATAVTLLPAAALYYHDIAKYQDAKQRAFANLHNIDGKMGRGQDLSDIADFEEARDGLMMSLAIAGTGVDLIGLGIGKAIFKNLKVLQQPGARLAVTKALQRRGLSALEIDKIMKNIASADARVQAEAAASLVKNLGVDTREISALSGLYRTNIIKEGDAKAFEAFKGRIRAIPEGPQREAAFAHIEDTLKNVNTAKINAGNREQVLDVIASGGQFGADPKVLAGRINDWDTGLDGLARTFDEAKRQMDLPEVRGLASAELRSDAAFERALQKLGVDDPEIRAMMKKCGLKPI